MTSTISDMMETYPAEINTDRELLAQCVEACVECAQGCATAAQGAPSHNRYLLVANQGTEDSPGTTVSVIDTKTFTVTATVETGQGSHGVVVDPSSQHAYVTNIYGDDVAVLDLQELKVVARIPVGDKPNGVSFSPLPNDAEDGSVTLDLPADPETPADEIEIDHGDGHEDGH